jgi:energy-coupling factor transporter ATP-binding protein EcfA2
MRIKTVTIRRFKQIQDVSLNLGDVTLLIGANNSGKSSILQALHFAVALAQSARLVGEGIAWQKDTFQLSLNPSQLLYSPVADVMSLATGGELQEPPASRIEIQLLTEDGESCTVGLRRGRNRNVAVLIEGRLLGERLMSIEHPFTVYAPGLAGIPREERYQSPGVVRRIVARGDANLVLRNVLRMLRRNEAAWSAFKQDMTSIFPNIEVEVQFDEDTDEHIDAHVKLGPGPLLPVDAAGTSVLQASQILAYIALFRPQMLILDEPDSHLHPDNQRALCDLIGRLSTEREFQALISTHSRHVLDAMSRRSSVVWLSKGAIVSEPDVNATRMLLDLGALDSIDYFADGALKCVVATEDTEKKPLKALLWSCGFVEDDTEVASYAGCSKTDAAVVLGKFLKDKAPHVAFVVHRDRDYMADDRAQKFSERLGSAGLHGFVTVPSDVEAYFINAEHLSYANPPLSAQRVGELIQEATEETRDESVASIVNLRTAEEFQRLRGTGKQPDHGKIAVEAARDYNASPQALRRGKVVLGRVIAKLHQELKANPKVFVASPHLKCHELEVTAKKIWPTPTQNPEHTTKQVRA